MAITGRGRVNSGRFATLAAAVSLVLAAASPVAAQYEEVRPTGLGLRVSGFAAGSLREGPDGIRLAKDVRSLTARITLVRPLSYQPFLQYERYGRPDLPCVAGFPCNDQGWIGLVGVTLPLTYGEDRPGLHPYAIAGIGWVFSDENKFTYQLGAGFALAFTRWFAPSLEFRWEDLPSLRNVVMVHLGLRLTLF